MNPVFKEYAQMLKEKTGLSLQEGYFWIDNQIVKCFDKEGNVHKLYRIKVEDDLSMSYTKPKSGYSNLIDNTIVYKGKESELASWEDVININKEHLNTIEEESLNVITSISNKNNDKQPVTLTSGGKDSSVVMHLVRQVHPESKAFFNNTTLDCADTYKHVKELYNIETITPKEGFYQWRKRLEFVPTRFARACCTIFKEGAMVEKLNKEDKYLFFLGMRNEESSTRSGYTEEWNNEKWPDTWKGCLPIRKWSELDVWLYIMYRNIPINEKYKKGYSRVGCACACPYYTKSTWVLDEYWYPTMRKRWVEILKDDFIRNNKWIIMNCTLDEYVQKAWNGGTYRDKATEEVIQEYSEYNNLDPSIARKYFDRTCMNGCSNKKGNPIKIKDKTTLAFNMKMFGRQIEKFMCKKCLMKEMNWDEEKWNEEAQRFKQQGCDLF